MAKKIQKVALKAGNYLGPLPVSLVSVGKAGERPNLITIAWSGTVNSNPPLLSISVMPKRYSHDIIVETGEFVINLVDKSLAKSLDYCGVKSFREVDKFDELKLTPVAVPELEHAPAVAEAPVSIACKVRQTLELGSHTMFIAEVLGAHVRSDLLDGKGALHLEQAGLLNYLHGQYFTLGEWQGFYGWSVASPEVKHKRAARQRKLHKK